MADIKVNIPLKDGNQLSLGKRQILDINYKSQSNTDPNSIHYSAVYGIGSLKILDINHEIEGTIKNKLFQLKPINISVFVKDYILNCWMDGATSDYDSQNQELIVNLSDSLKFAGFSYRKDSNQGTASAYDILRELFFYENYPKFSNSQTIEYLDDMLVGNTISPDGSVVSLKEHLSNIIIPEAYIEKQNIIEVINKICQIAQLQFIQEANGKRRFLDGRPIISTNQLIKIPKNNQYSDLKYNLITHNAYDCVKLDVYNVKTELRSIYDSETLTTCKDREYIGNEDGINPPQYDSYGGIDDGLYRPWFQFNYTLNLDDITSATTASTASIQGHNDLLIRINANIKVDESVNNQSIKSLADETTSKYLDKMISYTLPYHEFSNEQYDATSGNIYSLHGYADELSNLRKVDFRAQVMWHTERTSGSTTRNEFIQNFTFSIMSNVYSANPIEVIYGNGDNEIKLESNELLRDTTLYDTRYGNYKFSNILAGNVLDDYRDGISSGTITISCADYYDENGNLAINWGSGEIIQVGTDVQIEGSDKLWRVTGRTFRKAGCPFIDLELIEIKKSLSSQCNMLGVQLSEEELSISITPSQNFSVYWGDGTHTDYYDGMGTATLRHAYKDKNFSGIIKFYGDWQGVYDITNRDDITMLKYIDNIDEFPSLINCHNLREVTIPSGVTFLGIDTFRGCSNLKRVNYNADEVSDIPITSYNPFTGAGSTDEGLEIIFGDSVKIIPANLVMNNEALRSIDIGKGITSIRQTAFYGCSNLDSITIRALTPPALVVNAFGSTSSNLKIYIPKGTLDAYLTASGWSTYGSRRVFVEIDM